MRYELKFDFKLDDKIFSGYLITYNLADEAGNKAAILESIKEDGHKIGDESTFEIIKSEVIKTYEDKKKAEFLHYRVKQDRTSSLNEIQNALNGIDYRKNLPKEIEELAKEKNILIAFGASDDLLELRGAIYEELSASRGYSYDKDEDSKTFFNGVLNDIQLQSIWCPDETKSWEVRVKDGVEFRQFDIIEDGAIYCTGLIIALDKVYEE